MAPLEIIIMAPLENVPMSLQCGMVLESLGVEGCRKNWGGSQKWSWIVFNETSETFAYF